MSRVETARTQALHAEEKTAVPRGDGCPVAAGEDQGWALNPSPCGIAAAAAAASLQHPALAGSAANQTVGTQLQGSKTPSLLTSHTANAARNSEQGLFSLGTARGILRQYVVLGRGSKSSSRLLACKYSSTCHATRLDELGACLLLTERILLGASRKSIAARESTSV
jgi:hypothetical protein